MSWVARDIRGSLTSAAGVPFERGSLWIVGQAPRLPLEGVFLSASLQPEARLTRKSNTRAVTPSKIRGWSKYRLAISGDE